MEVTQDHIQIVHKIASKMIARMSGSIAYDDLVSEGFLGLTQALNSYKPEVGKFENYAQMRIRGQMLDFLRSESNNSRLDYQIVKQYNKLKLLNMSDVEIANKLEISIEKLNEAQLSCVSPVSLDEFLPDSESIRLVDAINADHPSLEYLISKSEFNTYLSNLLKRKLTLNEYKVLSMYYVEDLTLKQISKKLRLTESRISQIHSKATYKLKRDINKIDYQL